MGWRWGRNDGGLGIGRLMLGDRAGDLAGCLAPRTDHIMHSGRWDKLRKVNVIDHGSRSHGEIGDGTEELFGASTRTGDNGDFQQVILVIVNPGGRGDRDHLLVLIDRLAAASATVLVLVTAATLRRLRQCHV